MRDKYVKKGAGFVKRFGKDGRYINLMIDYFDRYAWRSFPSKGLTKADTANIGSNYERKACHWCTGVYDGQGRGEDVTSKHGTAPGSQNRCDR
jgi:hypothetical protein